MLSVINNNIESDNMEEASNRSGVDASIPNGNGANAEDFVQEGFSLCKKASNGAKIAKFAVIIAIAVILGVGIVHCIVNYSRNPFVSLSKGISRLTWFEKVDINSNVAIKSGDETAAITADIKIDNTAKDKTLLYSDVNVNIMEGENFHPNLSAQYRDDSLCFVITDSDNEPIAVKYSLDEMTQKLTTIKDSDGFYDYAYQAVLHYYQGQDVAVDEEIDKELLKSTLKKNCDYLFGRKGLKEFWDRRELKNDHRMRVNLASFLDRLFKDCENAFKNKSLFTDVMDKIIDPAKEYSLKLSIAYDLNKLTGFSVHLVSEKTVIRLDLSINNNHLRKIDLTVSSDKFSVSTVTTIDEATQGVEFDKETTELLDKAEPMSGEELLALLIYRSYGFVN